MAPHATPARISEFLDETLDIPAFPDYEHAFNGLQVEARTPVRRVGAAVDASVASITAAVEGGVDLLIVHHGIYWDGMRPVTGRRYDRIAPLVRAGAALYSAHLPLDAHPELGNAVQLARGSGWKSGRGSDSLPISGWGSPPARMKSATDSGTAWPGWSEVPCGSSGEGPAGSGGSAW